MDIKGLHRQGMSIRQIARTVGVSRKLVRRTLSQTVPARYKQRAPRAKKIDPFTGQLAELLACRPRARATWLYARIRESGYGGHYEAVKVWVREWRRTEQVRRGACVRFETDPGVEGQFDWKGPVRGLIRSMPEQKVWFFRFVLGYSRRRFTIAVTTTTLPMVLANLRTAFERAGGVPQRMVFDNFKAAVLRPRPQLELHPQFVEFCRHYGTEPSPALVYSPQRKGKVERSFQDLIDTGMLDRTWDSLGELQAAVDADDQAHAGRIVSSTGETPQARFERERSFLVPLPTAAFDVRVGESRRVLRDCTISWRGSWYSVPHTLVGRTVVVKAQLDGSAIEIFDRDQLAACHAVVGPGRRQIVEAHIDPLRRPRWDRVHPRNGKEPKLGLIAAEPALVDWPVVPVAQRAIEEYVAVIEGGLR